MTESEISGRPIWLDLASPDIEGAARFYEGLFGWVFTDQGDAFSHYRMVTKDGLPVAGAMSSLMSADGPTDTPQMPTTWSVYLQTDDITGTVDAVSRSSGQVLVPPMAVADLGTMAVVSDPAGAMVGLWQIGSFEGFAHAAGAGHPVWFETLSTDFDAALPFYRDVLKWTITPMGSDGQSESTARYVTNGAGDAAVAGLCDGAQWMGDMPSLWRAYFSVDDTDTACRTVTDLGGRVIDGPMDSPFGRLATVADPQGAMFQIISTRGQNAR